MQVFDILDAGYMDTNGQSLEFDKMSIPVTENQVVLHSHIFRLNGL